jgi:[CysO sulfur-carrier protein]-thiocarboxylate-dependent cysteine synthase
VPVEVRVPPLVQRVTGGQRTLQANGSTVSELLDNLDRQYPGFSSELRDGSGQVHRFVNIYVNDEDVRFLGKLDTPIKDGDVVSILPAMAGGAVAVARPGVYRDIVEAIGHTPLVELQTFSPKAGVRIFAKLEGHNPTGSVKDRIARAMIEQAELTGQLRPGMTVLEPTSGNTGIALAMIAGRRGYRVRVVMPENVSEERNRLLTIFGAEIVYSPASEGTNGSIRLAHRLAEGDPTVFMPYQYGNSANPLAHYETTGPEILEALPEVDVFVAGLGTGGTLMGTGRRLREHNRNVKVVAAEPYQGELVAGLRSLDDGFIPPVLNIEELDGKIMVTTADSFAATQRLARDEGVFAGVSCGAVVHAALRYGQRLERGNIVCLLADGGWKYLSSELWTKGYDESAEKKFWW